MPPILISFGTAIYACMALRWFMQRRAQFRELLAASASGLTTARYVRLMGLAFVEMISTLTLNLYVFIYSVMNVGLRPWISWQNVHSNFGRIAQYPTAIMPAKDRSLVLGTWALMPIGAFCFWAFFAFGEEASTEYKKWWRSFRRTVLRQSDVETRNTTGNVSLPSFVS
jgi:pheromone a factor receptor